MSFTDAIRSCFSKYVTFSGRASRPEYWWFILFIFAGSILASIVDATIFGTGEVVVTDTGFTYESNGPLESLFGLVTLLPALAAGWRRMHDSGRSGLYVIYPLIAFVGVMTFMSFVGGMELIAMGDFAGLFSGMIGLVLVPALIVVLISPLLVIWWLTRPTQPETNQWGPPPLRVAS